MSSLHDLIQDFIDQLSDAIESEAMSRAREAVENALGGAANQAGRLRAALKHTNGLNGAHLNGSGLRADARPRKKPPIQLCPVPGCSERAAPIFGMVCAKHKDLPKTKIKKYREERRAKKLGLKASGGRKPAARRAAKRPARKTAAGRKGKIKVKKGSARIVTKAAPAARPAAAPAATTTTASA
jgi:hypothetical protein